MAVNVHRERDIVRLKFIHIEFSSLSIYLHTAKLGCEIDDWKSFNLSIEFNVENMPFNENNKYGEFSSVESFSGVRRCCFCDKWNLRVFIR